MIIKDYLQNPYGKGSSFSSKRQQEELDKQYPTVAEKIACKIYKYRDFIIYHVIIPSTSNENVSYDVIFEMGGKALKPEDVDVENLSVKVFSNCPSFIFTYASVFHNQKILCDWLLPKYRKEVRQKFPIQRNQYGIIGLERSVYLAMRYLHVTGKTSLAVIKSTAKKINGRTEIINSVRTQDQVMEKVRAKISKDEKKPPSEVTLKKNLDFGTKSISNKKSTSKVKDSPFTKKVKKTSIESKTKTAKKSKTF